MSKKTSVSQECNLVLNLFLNHFQLPLFPSASRKTTPLFSFQVLHNLVILKGHDGVPDWQHCQHLLQLEHRALLLLVHLLPQLIWVRRCGNRRWLWAPWILWEVIVEGYCTCTLPCWFLRRILLLPTSLGSDDIANAAIPRQDSALDDKVKKINIT